MLQSAQLNFCHLCSRKQVKGLSGMPCLLHCNGNA